MSRFDKVADIDSSAIDALAQQVTGLVLAPDDEHYDEERAGSQTARSHLPDLLVAAAGPADVQAAVAFASRHGLPVGVQGTGHALAAIAAKGGLLINTSRMTDFAIDAEAGTARVGAGMRWDKVIEEVAPAGLAPLSGSAPSVGVISYTLGGGLGLLSRRYGYAADHVRGIDVVTADGEQRHASPDSNPDLFWALRGGRDNFGVVTGMEIDLVPVTALYGGGFFFPADSASAVFETYVQWTTTLPDEMTSSIAMISFPDVPALPEPLRGRHMVHVRIAYSADDLSAGEGLVAPLRGLGPVIDSVGEMPYTASGSIHNDPPVPGAFESGTAMLGDLDAAAVRAILDLAGPHAPVPHVVEVRHLGGKLGQTPKIANAVGHRDARYVINVVSRLERADIDDIRPAHQRMFEALAPWSTGGRALNFMNGEHDAEYVRSAYDADDYQRLTEIKAVHDPENMFRLNHNIPPAG